MKSPQFCPGVHGVRNRTPVFVHLNPFAFLLTWIFISLSAFSVVVVLVVVVVWTEQLQFSPFAQ